MKDETKEPKSATLKWMESAYAQFRLDGCTHEQAMAKIKAAMDKAIPEAVKTIMDEIRGPPPPPPMCRPCNGFGFHVGGARCDACDGVGRVSILSPQAVQSEDVSNA